MSLVAATRSETTKVFSTSGWWILAIVLLVYVGSTAAGLAFVLGGAASGILPETDGINIPINGLAALLYSLGGSIGYVFPLLIGTLMVTTEFRHQTLTPTFLATPRRGLVLWGKLVAAVIVGILFGVVAVVAAAAPAAGVLAGLGVDAELGSSDTWALFARTLLALVLWTMIGVGVGTLLRNQVVAIVVVLAFTQFVEPLLRLAGGFVEWLADVTRFLPGAASDALVGSSIYTATSGATGDSISWWHGGIVLLGYALVLLLVGHITSWRRDVT